MLNQTPPSRINVGKLDVVPTENSSSFNIELSSIYNQAETKMKENINDDNINFKIIASPESAHQVSQNFLNRPTNINTTVDNSPIRQPSLIYSYKSGNNSNVSIQTEKVSAISASSIIPKSKSTSQINNKIFLTSSTSDLSIEAESNEPLLTKISKDTHSTFSFQTLDSNVNTFVTSAPDSRICEKTKKLDHILEIACTMLGDEDIRYQDSRVDINSSVDSLSEYKTNQAFKIHLPPQEEDKKKLLEELVIRMFDNFDDEIFEKEIKESKMTDDITNKVKSLTTFSVRHRTENDDHLIEEKQKKIEHGSDYENQLVSKYNLNYTDGIENNSKNEEWFANGDHYYFTNNLRKIEIDVQSIVEFDEQEMLKYLNISKNNFSDLNTFENNSADEDFDENCMRKDSDEEIKQYGKHSQWFKRMRNYFHGEGLKVKK